MHISPPADYRDKSGVERSGRCTKKLTKSLKFKRGMYMYHCIESTTVDGYFFFNLCRKTCSYGQYGVLKRVITFNQILRTFNSNSTKIMFFDVGVI